MSQSTDRYFKETVPLPFTTSLVYRCSKSIKEICMVLFCTAFFFLVFLLEVMGAPPKYHGEEKKQVNFRMTPTGVRLLTEKYIGPGKLVDNMATLVARGACNRQHRRHTSQCRPCGVWIMPSPPLGPSSPTLHRSSRRLRKPSVTCRM